MSGSYNLVEEETVDLERNEETTQTKEKQPKIYQPRSKVWLHFEKFTDNEGVSRARCKHCACSYKYGSKSHGTSNLNLHLKKCVPYLATISDGQTQLAFQFGDENKLTSWKFDQKAIRKALAQMIIADELPFSFVENAGFRYFISMCQPSFKVPCRSTITKDVYRLFVEEKEKVGDFIKKNIGRICLTTDTWTSSQQSSYMCLTAHFVDNEWKLKKKVLSFCPRENHRGIDIGKMIEKCLKEWGIENVFTISVDNASANDVAIEFLKRTFQNSNKCLLNGKWIHIRCVAHILNLVVQDGIKKVDRSVEIVRWAVRWIRQSPSRIDKFHNFAKLVNCGTTRHLIRDVPTRWNSIYHMLDIAQSYEQTFERYDLEEHDFKTDIEKAGLAIPSPTDWQNVRYLCHFLKPFYDVTLRVSGTLYVTSNACIEDIYSIRTVLYDAIHDDNLHDIAMAMKVKFDKYFDNLDKMNLLLYFALSLDPRNKVKYLVILLEDCYGANVMESKKKFIMDFMYELYNDYTRIHSSSSTCSTTESTTSSSILGKRQNPDAMAPKPPLRNKLREKMKTNIVESVGELEKYVNESVEENSSMFNILEWWKVNSPRFPILSLMARDLCAIPVSTVASESVFSTSGRVLDPFRSSLTPRIVESLICTQDWLRCSSSDKPEFEEDWETIQEIDQGLDLAS